MVQVLGRGICTLSEANWFRTTSHGPVYRGMLIPEAATYDEEMHWLASMHEPWISACSPNRIRGNSALPPQTWPVPQPSGKSEMQSASSSAHDSYQGTSEATRRHCDRPLCWGPEELHTSSVAKNSNELVCNI